MPLSNPSLPPVPDGLQARADLAVHMQAPDEKPSFRSLLMELDNMESGLKTDFDDLPDEAQATHRE